MKYLPYVKALIKTYRQEYKKALKINKKLAVNANKFKKSKFLLLYTVIEKDESNFEKD